MKKTSLIRALTVAASVGLVAGPLSTSHALFDKTRFVAHLGVAYYAFHHFVSGPFRAGQFSHAGAGTYAKAGAALLFAAHEVNVAEKVAHNSKSPLLQKLDGQLVGLKSSFGTVGDRLKHGQFNAADLQALDSQASAVSSASAAAGQPIKDVTAPIPGL